MSRQRMLTECGAWIEIARRNDQFGWKSFRAAPLLLERDGLISDEMAQDMERRADAFLPSGVAMAYQPRAIRVLAALVLACEAENESRTPEPESRDA
jgi:hypothetical protein